MAPGRRFRLKGHLSAAPDEAYCTRVQRMIWQDQPLTLHGCQSVLHECQVQVFVSTVKLFADDGVAGIGQVNADLMLAARARYDPQK